MECVIFTDSSNCTKCISSSYDNHFSSLKMVSVYSVYNMVMSGINGVMSVFSTGVSAGFGELIVKKDKTAFQRHIVISNIFIILWLALYILLH